MRASARLALGAIQLACAAATGGPAGGGVLRIGPALPLGSGFTLTPDGGCTTCADCPAELEAKAPAAARAVLTLATNGAALGYRFTEDFQADVSAGQIPHAKPLPRRCHPLTPGCLLLRARWARRRRSSRAACRWWTPPRRPPLRRPSPSPSTSSRPSPAIQT